LWAIGEKQLDTVVRLEVVAISNLDAGGRPVLPFFLQMMVGEGLPVNVQLKIAVLVSNTFIEMGSVSTAIFTGEMRVRIHAQSNVVGFKYPVLLHKYIN